MRKIERPSIRIFLNGILMAIVIGALGVSSWGCSSQRAEGVAPDFGLDLYQSENGSDETSLALSDYRGRPVVVNFWAVWCAPCREEMPALERAYRAFNDDGLVDVADLGVVGFQWGTGSPGASLSGGGVAVPAPATAVSGMTLLGGMLLRRQRRR